MKTIQVAIIALTLSFLLGVGLTVFIPGDARAGEPPAPTCCENFWYVCGGIPDWWSCQPGQHGWWKCYAELELGDCDVFSCECEFVSCTDTCSQP